MQSQKKPYKKPSIPIDAWELIEQTLLPDPPTPDKPTWKLVAEQERLRLLDVLKHRVNVYGISNDT